MSLVDAVYILHSLLFWCTFMNKINIDDDCYIKKLIIFSWENMCNASCLICTSDASCQLSRRPSCVCLIVETIQPRLHDTTCCQTGCPVWQPVVSCIQTFNRLSNPFDNRFVNRLYRVYSRLSNRLYNPVWQPVERTVQPDWQPVVSCKRGIQHSCRLSPIHFTRPKATKLDSSVASVRIRRNIFADVSLEQRYLTASPVTTVCCRELAN